jgi:diguanylate cyclase (GGDEF)-like protein/PAS domain S-box-containing protein
MPFPQVVTARHLKLIRVSLAIAAVYVAAAKFGFTMAFTAEQVTLVWPPTGLALAALLVLGPDVWPGIFLGAFLANITSHEPLAVALGIASGNTLEAVLAAWLVRRYVEMPCSRSWLRCTLVIIGFCAIASTMVSATIGMTSLCLGGLQPWSAFAPLWRTWCLGDAAADLIIVPAILAFGARPRAITWRQGIEIGAIIAGLSIACVVVFARRLDSAGHYPLEYLVFPFLIWAAIRFGIAGAAIANVLTSAVAIWGTMHALGPYAAAQGPQGDERLMLLQIFLGVMSSSSLLLGATVSDRDASRVRKVSWLEAALDCIISMDHTGRIIEFNPAAERTFGHSRGHAIGRDFGELLLPEHLRDYHRRAITQRDRLGDPGLLGRRFETVALRADGTEFPVELSLSHMPTAGAPTFTAFVRDITEQKRMVKQLAFRATHDGLTNVLNNAAFMERLTLAARQANIGGRQDIAVLFADLNKFKAINDKYGHVVGFGLLRARARGVGGAVGPRDSVARLGGDEFAILLEHVTDHGDVDAVLHRVQRALAQPFNVDGQEIQASASVGIALASEHGPRPQDMLRAADLSMYQVKSAQV